MEFELIEGLMVLTLFFGYLALWRFKKRKMLRHTGSNPEVIYDDNRPTQKFFANISRLMSVFIALLIVFHSAGVKYNFGFYPIVFLDNNTVNIIGFVLGLIGLLLCWRAQQEMGHSWRVGIDRQNMTELAIYYNLDIVLSRPCAEYFAPRVGLEQLDNFKTLSFLCWNSNYSYRFAFGNMGIRHAWN